ncbi:hypothetical protein COO60DRAFT_664941 [Scenedesmus sp. NREL 46B-D3]|nr:hypothetical protein COO60DRAFT_664941 [Scenedesmus sp. NREL 46B-D3]
MENMAALHGSLPNQGMMHHAAAHAKMPFGHSANNPFSAAHRANSDSLAAAMAAAASLGSVGMGSGSNSPCSPALMAARAAAAAANHSRGGSPAADLAALQAAAVGSATTSSSGGGRRSRLSNSSSAFADGTAIGHMQPPRAGSALQGSLPAAHNQQQQPTAMHGMHLGRAHSAPVPSPLLAAQQQQQASNAAGKAAMSGKTESQQQMMQRMYSVGVPADRSAISPPGLLSGRHAAAAAPAGSEASAVPFSMGMNIRPVAGGQAAAGHPLSPGHMRDTASVRDTGAAAYAAAEVQAHMQQRAVAQQEQQARDADLAGHEGDSSDGDAHAPNLLPLIKEIWSR